MRQVPKTATRGIGGASVALVLKVAARGKGGASIAVVPKMAIRGMGCCKRFGGGAAVILTGNSNML